MNSNKLLFNNNSINNSNIYDGYNRYSNRDISDKINNHINKNLQNNLHKNVQNNLQNNTYNNQKALSKNVYKNNNFIDANDINKEIVTSNNYQKAQLQSELLKFNDDNYDFVNFKETVRTWLELDDDIRTLRKAINERNKKKINKLFSRC
jgi:Lhr-like helicase